MAKQRWPIICFTVKINKVLLKAECISCFYVGGAIVFDERAVANVATPACHADTYLQGLLFIDVIKSVYTKIVACSVISIVRVAASGGFATIYAIVVVIQVFTAPINFSGGFNYPVLVKGEFLFPAKAKLVSFMCV